MADMVFGICAGFLLVVGLASLAYAPAVPALAGAGLLALAVAGVFGFVAMWL